MDKKLTDKQLTPAILYSSLLHRRIELKRRIELNYRGLLWAIDSGYAEHAGQYARRLVTNTLLLFKEVTHG
jgi:hypothetical protein